MDEVYISIAIAAIISFTFTYLLVPYFNRFCIATGIVGMDIMKRDRKPVADMGGPGVISGFLIGVFFYIGMRIFMFKEVPDLIYLLASISTVLIITLIGIFDVLTSLMMQREGTGLFERMKRKGIPNWVYYLIPLPAAVPLAAIKAGVSTMVLPLIGEVEFGLTYPLVLIPLAVLCCSNATNFYAGFNGLEAGMGFVLHASLGFFAIINDRPVAALIAFTFAASLIAFLRYNWCPAEVFPGDLNHTIGAACVCVAVIGNMERFAILCFTPWVIEALLKATSKFQAENYGVLQEDGTVRSLYDQIYSMTHLIMKLGRFKECEVSLILIALEMTICLVSYVLGG